MNELGAGLAGTRANILPRVQKSAAGCVREGDRDLTEQVWLSSWLLAVGFASPQQSRSRSRYLDTLLNKRDGHVPLAHE